MGSDYKDTRTETLILGDSDLKDRYAVGAGR